MAVGNQACLGETEVKRVGERAAEKAPQGKPADLRKSRWLLLSELLAALSKGMASADFLSRSRRQQSPESCGWNSRPILLPITRQDLGPATLTYPQVLWSGVQVAGVVLDLLSQMAVTTYPWVGMADQKSSREPHAWNSMAS